MLKVISYTFLAAFGVDLLALTGDTTMTWTSPVFPKIETNDTSKNPLDRPATAVEESWISCLISLGAIIGPFPFGFMAEKLGRKITLLSIAVPHFISFLTLAFATNINIYYFARFLGGIAIGGGYTLLPMYIAEIAEDSNRGQISVTLNVFWSTGNLLPYVVGPFVSILWFNVILSILPVTFFVVFLTVSPETPYYLVKAKKNDQAKKSLMFLRNGNDEVVRRELKFIEASVEEDEKGTFADLVKTKGQIKALVISLGLIMFQQLSGYNAITGYAQPIFDAAGSTLAPEISSIIVGSTLIPASILAPFFADRAGRRFLLLLSSFGMALSQFVFGVYFYLKDNTDFDIDSISWLPIISFIVYVVTFTFGFASIPWTISSELFPTHVKAIAASLTSMACWATSFFVTRFFNDLNEALGIAGTFWLFGGICISALVFTYVLVPETKGKDFKEIQRMLEM